MAMLRQGSVRSLMALRTARPAAFAHKRWVETVSGIDTPAPNVVLPWEQRVLPTTDLSSIVKCMNAQLLRSSATFFQAIPSASFPYHKSSFLSLQRHRHRHRQLSRLVPRHAH